MPAHGSGRIFIAVKDNVYPTDHFIQKNSRDAIGDVTFQRDARKPMLP
jgi:hypothetical protein